MLAKSGVLMIGGGSVGCCAAIFAGTEVHKRGIRVSLIERYGFLGGISTQSLDTCHGVFTSGEVPRKIVECYTDMIVARVAATHNALASCRSMAQTMRMRLAGASRRNQQQLFITNPL